MNTPANTDQTTAAAKSMDDIMSLCKRRGFIYQASEIYGGINGFWDYGPLGAQLKKNLRDAWWNDVVMLGAGGEKGPNGKPVRIVPVDTCIIQNPKVWEASGHVAGFNDPMVDDMETKQRFRADHLVCFFLADSYETAPAHFTKESGPEELLSTRGSTTIVPLFTVIGSNEFEAVERLQSNKALRKINGIKSIEWLLSSKPADKGPFTGDHFLEDIRIDRGKGPETYTAKMGDLKAMSTMPEVFPSPFTGKNGTLTPPRDFNLMFDTIPGAIRDATGHSHCIYATGYQGFLFSFQEPPEF